MSGPETFEDILNEETPDVVRRPPPMPSGTYQWIISGPHRYDKTPKGTDVIEFPLTCQGAGPDVDEEQLAAFGDPSGKSNRISFYVTPDAKWRLDSFFREILQLDAGLTRKQSLAESVNGRFWAKVKHVPAGDGQTIYANIDTNSLAAV